MMLLDTYAWIELFTGSTKGKKVEEIIKSETKIFISILSLAEITVWCLRNQKNVSERLEIVKKYSEILDLSEKIVEIGGRINFEIKKKEKTFGMIDSLIYATAQIYSLKLLTGDKHFKNLDDVIML